MSGRRTFVECWSEAVSSHEEGYRLWVKVSPGASQNQVVGMHDRYLKVRVTAPPERGKANRMVEKLLSAEAGMTARVISGHSSRLKKVKLSPRRDNL